MQQIDCPGFWHDGTQAGCGVCSELEWIHTLCGARMVVGSALGLQSKDFLIKSGEEHPILHGMTTRAEDARAVLLNRQATSLSFQGQRTIFQLEEFGERKVVLHLMVLLHDHQAMQLEHL